MEQATTADELLLSALQQAGCPLSDEALHVTDLTADILGPLLAHALLQITDGDAQFPRVLPRDDVPARQQVCAAMAALIQDLGYREPLQYHHLLYPNAHAVRPLLLWVLENLPSAHDHAAVRPPLEDPLGGPTPDLLLDGWQEDEDQDSSGRAARHRRIGRLVWEPEPVQTPALQVQAAPDKESIPAAAELEELSRLLSGEGPKDAVRDPLPEGLRDVLLPPEAVTGDQVARTAARQNVTSRGAGFSALALEDMMALVQEEADGEARFLGSCAPAFATAARQAAQRARDSIREPTAPDAAKASELSQLHADIRAQKQRLREMGEETLRLASGSRMLQSELAKLAAEAEQREKEYTAKVRALSLLSNAAENVTALERSCAERSKALLQMGRQWEVRRKPLVEAVDEQEREREARKERCGTLLQIAKRHSAELQAMRTDVSHKEELVRALDEQYLRAPKGPDLRGYFHAVEEATIAVLAQAQAARASQAELREARKEVAGLLDTLARAEALADEKIYAAAEQGADKEPEMVLCYRYLTDLQDKFDQLLEAIQEEPRRDHHVRSLERRLTRENAKMAGHDLPKVQEDIQLVRDLNEVMIDQMQSNAGSPAARE